MGTEAQTEPGNQSAAEASVVGCIDTTQQCSSQSVALGMSDIFANWCEIKSGMSFDRSTELARIRKELQHDE